MKTTHNNRYEAPAMKVLELHFKGIICLSGDANATMDGTFGEETI